MLSISRLAPAFSADEVILVRKIVRGDMRSLCIEPTLLSESVAVSYGLSPGIDGTEERSLQGCVHFGLKVRCMECELYLAHSCYQH